MPVLNRIIVILGVLAVGLTALVAIVENPVVDLDLWGQLAMGRETLARGWPPLEDPFTYVPTLKPFIYHEWLTGVTYYLMLEHLGPWSFQGLRVALGLSTMALAALAGRRMGGSLLSIGVILFMVLPNIELGYSPIRAQAFTFFLFSLFVVLLEEVGRGRHRLLWLFPLIGAVWANLHGGFVAGVGLILLYIVSHFAAGQKPWWLVAAGGATIVASLLNPYGVDYWTYLLRAIPMSRPHIAEWRPVPMDLVSFLGFKALVVLAALTFFATPRRSWPGFMVLAATAGLAFRHLRHIPFFAVAAVAYLSPQLTPLVRRASSAIRARAAVRPLLSAILMVFALGVLDLAAVQQLSRVTSWRLVVPASYYPVGAVEFLRINHLSGNLATPFRWGEYVLWKLYPQVKVSFDGRYETVYPEHVSDAAFRLMYGRDGWWRLLEEYPTDMVLVHKANRIAAIMREQAGWAAVYEDDISAVYRRAAESNGPWIYPPRVQEGSFP